MLARTCNIILKGAVGGLRFRPSIVIEKPASPASSTQSLPQNNILSLIYLERSAIKSRAGQRLDNLNRSHFVHHRSYTINIVKNPRVSPQEELNDFEDSLRAHLQTLLANVELSADYFKAQQDSVDAKHKQLLGDLWKRSLAFNPLADPLHIHLHFMPRQTNDPVYKQFERYARAPQYLLHSLRAISGAGKAGTILNAIGRKQYLFYVQCGTRTADQRDYADVPAQTFISAVIQHNLSLVDRGASKTERTYVCRAYCTVFWLCRSMLLEAMKEKFGKVLTPERWILWSNDGGQKVIDSLQMHAFSELRSLMAKHPSWLETPQLSDLLRLYHNKHPEVWFAIDEAQVIQEHLKDDIISLDSVDKHPSNFLHALAVHSLPPKARTVVAGTRMARFDEFEGSYGAKGSSVYKLAEREESYLYVTSEQTMKILSEWINLDGITEQNLERARYQFLQYTSEGSRVDRKNKFFEQGLTNLKQDIDHIMKAQWEKVMKITNIKPANAEVPDLIPNFPEHVLTLLMAHLSTNPVTWDAKEFLSRYKIAAEDTGFLFFDKVKKDEKNGYLVREPQLVPTVVKLLMPYYPQQALRSLIEVDEEDPTQLWFLKKHSGQHAWCKDLICKWTDVNKAQSLSDFQSIIKNVRALKKKAKWSQEALCEVHYLLSCYGGRRAEPKLGEDVNLPALLPEIARAGDEQIGELLFMYAQPTGLLLRPSDQMGPDLIGFCETSRGEKVLVLVDFPGERQEQFEKNLFKHETMNKIPLPEKILMISIATTQTLSSPS